MADPAGVRRVGRVGPVVEQRAEVDQRLAERRHVPVEDRLDAVGVGRVELAVVELEVVVHDRHPGRRRQRRRQALGQLVHHAADRRRDARGPSASASRRPGGRRSPSGRPRSARSAAAGSSRCSSAIASTRAKPIRRPTSAWCGHRRRHAVADDLAAAALHHDEVRADRPSWSSQNRYARGARSNDLPEPRQHPVLALHVVGAGRDRRRTAAGAAPARSSPKRSR